MASKDDASKRLGKLSKRELEATQMVAKGKTNREIATALHLQEQSIKNLISSAMRKVGVRNRVELCLLYNGIDF